ncbi:MAG: YncE family protein [Bryobacteraceae bacterium]
MRCIGLLLALPLMAATVRVIQTNSAGDNIHLIDPGTNKVVGVIEGVEVNHGVAVAPDGSRFYVSNEADHALDVVDGKSLKVFRKVPLTGRPNNIDISKDGKRVYVAINVPPGALDVIDTASLERVRSIPMKGAVHNTYVTPDGKYVIGGSIAGRMLTAINYPAETVAWELPMESGVRPMAFSRKPNGATGKIFMNLSELHGFVVIDFDQRKEVARVTLPKPDAAAVAHIAGTPSHGLAVSPDGKSVWCNSSLNSSVYGYSIPDLKLIGGVKVGVVPDWLTFANGMLYVANAGSNTTSAVDIGALRVKAVIPVGQVPKRNITFVFP